MRQWQGLTRVVARLQDSLQYTPPERVPEATTLRVEYRYLAREPQKRVHDLFTRFLFAGVATDSASAAGGRAEGARNKHVELLVCDCGAGWSELQEIAVDGAHALA